MTGDDTGGPWIPGSVNDRSVTGFRIRHGSNVAPMSRSFYYGMKKRGEGPREKHVGGKVLITIEAEAEWDARDASPDGAEARSIEKINAMRYRRGEARGRGVGKVPQSRIAISARSIEATAAAGEKIARGI